MLAIMLLVIVWEGVYRIGFWPPFLLPSPYQVGQTLWYGIADFSLVIAVVASFQRLLIGYVLAVVLGTILGVALAKVRWLDQTIGFLTLGLQTVPSIVWLPLALLWFGLNDKAVIFVVVIGALWTMVISVKSAIQGVSPLLIRVARTLSYSNIRLFFKVILPAGLPGIITGLRLAWAFAWRSLMAGELLGSGAGLGQVLITGRNLGDMSLVIAVMLIVGVLGSVIDLLLFQQLESGVLEKWGHAKQG